MSDLMDRAVIGMPFDMTMRSHLSRLQFYNRAQAILAERDALLAERDAAFAVGQEDMRERVIGETTATRAEDATRDRIRALPIKPRP